jgi:hypothetical protein
MGLVCGDTPDVRLAGPPWELTGVTILPLAFASCHNFCHAEPGVIHGQRFRSRFYDVHILQVSGGSSELRPS